MKDTSKPTNKYRHFNHHHEITDGHEIVDFGDGEFIANKQAIPLLKALNEAGLRTRTHHMDDTGSSFVSILLDNAQVEIKKVNEVDSTRTKYNGKTELLIYWDNPNPSSPSANNQLEWIPGIPGPNELSVFRIEYFSSIPKPDTEVIEVMIGYIDDNGELNYPNGDWTGWDASGVVTGYMPMSIFPELPFQSKREE